jgi:hypothetical protein
MSPRSLVRPAIVVAPLLALAACLPVRADEVAAWSTDGAESLVTGELRDDHQVQLAQAVAPRGSNRSVPARTVVRSSRTSRVPYMIGDSPSSPTDGLGASVGFSGIDIADAEHPVFGGGRFNAAENAISFPTDRIYANYRHFSGAYDVDVLGQQSSLPVDRLDVGFEKTAFDGLMSAELRLPIVRQLNSDLEIFSDSGGGNLPISDRTGELGNLAVNVKLLLVSRRTFGVSTGLGVTCPTGEDAYIDMFLDEPSLTISQSPLVSSIAPTNISFVGQFANETVNLVPYVAWFVRPGRFFHQGFLQIDAPLNRSTASVQVDGQITPDSAYSASTFNVAQTGEIDQQSLLRANFGFGYWLTQGPPGGLLQGLAGLFEVHYTTALDNANPFVVPVTTLDAIGPTDPDVPIDVVSGPVFNNVDIVNMTLGVVADLGSCQVTNGFVFPVTDGRDRAFDFEYSLQMNRRF